MRSDDEITFQARHKIIILYPDTVVQYVVLKEVHGASRALRPSQEKPQQGGSSTPLVTVVGTTTVVAGPVTVDVTVVVACTGTSHPAGTDFSRVTSRHHPHSPSCNRIIRMRLARKEICSQKSRLTLNPHCPLCWIGPDLNPFRIPVFSCVIFIPDNTMS